MISLKDFAPNDFSADLRAQSRTSPQSRAARVRLRL